MVHTRHLYPPVEWVGAGLVEPHEQGGWGCGVEAVGGAWEADRGSGHAHHLP